MKIGIDVGGSHIGIGVISEDLNRIIDKISIFTADMKLKDNLKEEKIKEFIVLNIVTNIKNFKAKYENSLGKLTKIGIGFPGKVVDNVIFEAKNLGINKFDLINELYKYFNKEEIEITIKNDAEAAALAEYTNGSLKGEKNSCFLCLGTGIGSVIIKNGVFLEEGRELGHMIINHDGEKCTCGKKGCFEAYSSMKVLKEKLSENLKVKNMKVEEIIENYNMETCNEVLDDYISYLVSGLINIVEIFDVNTICLGGSFSNLKDTIVFEKIKEKLENSKIYILDKEKKIQILPAKYFNKSGMIGSLI